jgi:non-ribosomal peptide synthetase component F
MAKKFDDTVLDGALNVIKNGATTAVFCSAEPANYAGINAVALITKANMTSANFTGPADHTSGRKLTAGAITGMTPSANGTVAYVVLTNGSNTVYAGTTVTSQAVTTLQTWDSPAFILSIADPT